MTVNLTPPTVIDGMNYLGITGWYCPGGRGSNPACKQAHREGRSFHVSPAHPRNTGKDSYLIMPTYHYASLEEGYRAVLHAEATAHEATSDEEWLRLEAEGKEAFRTRAGYNHPTRR